MVWGYDFPGGWDDSERFTRHTSGRVPSLRNLAEDALYPAPKQVAPKPMQPRRETPVTKVKGVPTTRHTARVKTSMKVQAKPVRRVTLNQLMDTDDPVDNRVMTTRYKQSNHMV